TSCSEINVLPTHILKDQTRSICQAIIDNGGKTKDCIFLPDHTYQCHFQLANCCRDEEYGTYTIRPNGPPGQVYFIGCHGERYKDPINRYYYDCLNQKLIQLPIGSLLEDCDSSIIVTAIFPELSSNFTNTCFSGYTEINPAIKNITKSCGAGESFNYSYSWYFI